ncbi:MAG: hypothetical protein AB1846_04750, partial [Chloroflexota bacterium]
VFNRDFFYKTPNRLDRWLGPDKAAKTCLRLIAVEDYRPGHCLSLVMDDDLGKAVAFLKKDEE